MSPFVHHLTHVLRRWRRLRLPLLLGVVLLGVLLTRLVATQVREDERRLRRLAFEAEVEARVALIERAVSQAQEKVYTLGDFMHLGEVSLTHFDDFVLPSLRRRPALYALAYSDVVSESDRAAYEAARRAEGDADFRITDQDAATGEPVPAAARPVHVVMRSIRSRRPLGAVLGYDAAGEASRMETLAAARDSGELAATPMVQLVGDTAQQASVILYRAVYAGGVTPHTLEERRRLVRGYAAGSFHLPTMIERAMRGVDPALRVEVFDASQAGGAPLYATKTAAATGRNVEELVSEKAIRVADRGWRVRMRPTQVFVDEHPVGEGLLAWVIGLGLTALVGAVLWDAFRHAERVARLSRSVSMVNARLRKRVQQQAATQRELTAANEELQQLNTEMESFVSAVSHDLKTPLFAADLMAGAAQRALQRDKPDDATGSIASIKEACRQMQRLIDDLIEHARAGWGELNEDTVDLTQLAQEAVAAHRPRLDQHAVEVHIDNDMPTLRVDRGRVLAAVTNLVGNAIKYGRSDDGSPSRIDITWRYRGGADGDGDLDHQGEGVLRVSDTGRGIPPEHRDDVFRMFRRLKSGGDAEEGTGIGLSIVKRVVEAHRGRVWIEDTPGGGATFCLAFPRHRIVDAASGKGDGG